MKSFLKKWGFATTAVILAVIFASPAMAIISTGRSEEMVFQSDCDQAGTLELKFTENDVELMAKYLLRENTPKLTATANPLWTRPGDPQGIPREQALPYIRLEVTLSALNLVEPLTKPITLCDDIGGDGTGFIGANGQLINIPAVPLEEMNAEVSDVVDSRFFRPDPELFPPCDQPGDDIGWKDVTAYVYGQKGSTKFTIYITDIENNEITDPEDPNVGWNNQNNWPWIKVGLDENQLNFCEPQPRKTTICLDVSGFPVANLDSTVNVNVDIIPEELTYTTSDSQIGHFQAANVELFECEKNGVACLNKNSDKIELCPLDLDEQDQCDTEYECILLTGDVPTDELLKFIVESETDGVYIKQVTVYDDDGLLTKYTPQAGDDLDRYGSYYSTTELYEDRVTSLNCTFLAVYSQTVIRANDIEDLPVRICIEYNVNKNEELGPVPEEGESAVFNISLETVEACPSVIISEPWSAGEFIACGQLDTCMYFPYVIADFNPWVAGVAITNLSDKVAVEDMEITVKLRDRDGNEFTGQLPESIVSGKVVAFSIDSLATAMGWELSAQPGLYWLWVTGNFPMDGYSFLTDTVFGAGTLPRLLDSCEDDGITSIR